METHDRILQDIETLHQLISADELLSNAGYDIVAPKLATAAAMVREVAAFLHCVRQGTPSHVHFRRIRHRLLDKPEDRMIEDDPIFDPSRGRGNPDVVGYPGEEF